MAVTAQSLKDRFPEFTSESNTRVTANITAANLEISQTQWGALADEGTLHLAAHKLCVFGKTKDGLEAEPGPVKSEKVGEVAAEYAVATSGGGALEEESLRATAYGREYMRLKRLIFPLRIEDTSGLVTA